MFKSKVPNNIINSETNSNFGNLLISSGIEHLDIHPNKENLQNANFQGSNPTLKISNSNTKTFPSSEQNKINQNNHYMQKIDNSDVKMSKNSHVLSVKFALNTQKKGNLLSKSELKKLSDNQKIVQSKTCFDDSIKENLCNNNYIKIDLETKKEQKNDEMIIDDDIIKEKGEKNNILIKNNFNNNCMNINKEINLEYITVKKNLKELKSPSLTSITYKEYNSTLLPFEYLNDIWENFLEKEGLNYYSQQAMGQIQKDIKPLMRSILVDWIISLQNYFFTKKDTLFLTINLIDRYISKKPILRTRFQLLGVTALFISFKYEEIYMKHINDFVDLTDKAFTKEQILEMEEELIDLVDFSLDLPLSTHFFDLLSTVYKFDRNEFHFGCFLLEAFLLDSNCCKYKQSQIALGACYIVLGRRHMNQINEDNNFIKLYSQIYKINFEIWKDISIIIECAKNMYLYFENRQNNNMKEVYKVFNNLFI